MVLSNKALGLLCGNIFCFHFLKLVLILLANKMWGYNSKGVGWKVGGEMQQNPNVQPTDKTTPQES